MRWIGARIVGKVDMMRSNENDGVVWRERTKHFADESIVVAESSRVTKKVDWILDQPHCLCKTPAAREHHKNITLSENN